jgi:hypothetical protein
MLSVRIMRFPIVLVFPLRCLDEVLEGWTDVLCLFKRACEKQFATLSAVDDALAMLRAYGPLDLVDIDAGGADGRVKIKLLLR